MITKSGRRQTNFYYSSSYDDDVEGFDSNNAIKQKKKKPKQFDEAIYGSDLAKELETYCAEYRLVSTNKKRAEKIFRESNIHFNHYHSSLKQQSGGILSNTPSGNNLGKYGNFSEVRYSMDDEEYIIETKVCGPAHSRIQSIATRSQQNTKLVQFQRLTKQQETIKKDWRKSKGSETENTEFTRKDTDFFTQVQRQDQQKQEKRYRDYNNKVYNNVSQKELSYYSDTPNVTGNDIEPFPSNNQHDKIISPSLPMTTSAEAINNDSALIISKMRQKRRKQRKNNLNLDADLCLKIRLEMQKQALAMLLQTHNKTNKRIQNKKQNSDNDSITSDILDIIQKYFQPSFTGKNIFLLSTKKSNNNIREAYDLKSFLPKVPRFDISKVVSQLDYNNGIGILKSRMRQVDKVNVKNHLKNIVVTAPPVTKITYKLRRDLRRKKKMILHTLLQYNGKMNFDTDIIKSDLKREEESIYLLDAAEEVDFKMVQMAVLFGADVNFYLKSMNTEEKSMMTDVTRGIRKGRTAFQIVFCKLCDIEKDHYKQNKIIDKSYASEYEKILLFLGEHGANINSIDDPCCFHNEGWSPLHYAAHHGLYHRCKWLLSLLSLHNNQRELLGQLSIRSFKNQETPLMIACQNGSLNIVLLFLLFSASVAPFSSSLKRHLNILSLLNQKNENGWMALHFAIKSGNIILLEFLLDCGCGLFTEIPSSLDINNDNSNVEQNDNSNLKNNDNIGRSNQYDKGFTLAIDICRKYQLKNCEELLLKKQRINADPQKMTHVIKQLIYDDNK